MVPLLFERFAAHTSVVSVDLPAHGESPGAFEDLTFPTLDDAIDSFIDANALERRVVLVGHSMGGVLAYRAAARRADVAAVVLLAPGFEVVSRFLTDLKERALRDGTAVFSQASREYRVSRAFFESRVFDFRALAPEVAQPALIVIGDLDHTVGQEACRTLASAVSRGSFILAEGEGHDLTGLSYWSSIVSFISDLDSEARGI